MLSRNVPHLPMKTWTDPPQAMDPKYRLEDPVEAYRNYYKHGKVHLHKWTKRQVPTFILEGTLLLPDVR
jgi:hypothetical protein